MNRAVCAYWAGRIQSIVPLYPSLKWLAFAFDLTEWPKIHSLLEFSGDLREVPCIGVHLKIVTGTYILQTNRHSFNQNQVDPLCLLCKGANATIANFLLDCTTLEITRQNIIKDFKHIHVLRNCGLDINNSETLLHLLIDCSAVIDSKTVSEVIFHIRRLCYTLHIERYRRLSVVPGRKRNRKT